MAGEASLRRLRSLSAQRLALPRTSGSTSSPPIVSTKPDLPTPVLKSARGSGAKPERPNGETIGFSADDALLRLMPAVSTQRISHGFDRPGGVAFEPVVDEHVSRLAGFPGPLGDAPDRLTRVRVWLLDAVVRLERLD